MAVTTQNFNNSALGGIIVADGFSGAPSTTDIANQRNSTQPALFPNGFTNQGGQTQNTVTIAAAGATQGTATAIPATAAVVNVTTTTSSEGVKLPTAATGKTITVAPPTTKGVKIYGGAAGQLINANTTATTAFAAASAQPVTFIGVDATHWRVNPATAGTNSTLNATGLATLSGGLTVSGAQTETITTLAAAGATQGNAAAIAAGAVLVNVTVTTSTEGVKLPAPTAGRVITLLTPTNKGYKVYTNAAGVVINAATTATTAFAMSTNKPATFYAVDTTHWRASKSA